MRKLSPLLIITILCGALLVSPSLRRASAADCTRTSVGFIPLNDLGTGTHNGAQGGLYPGGSNVRPAAHEIGGIQQARAIRPLDANGQPSANGKIVLLSIGMSNTAAEFITFQPLAEADPRKNPALVIVNGAQGGMPAEKIIDPNSPTGMQFWGTVDQRLANAGITPAQVQVAWVKQANSNPTDPFPNNATLLQGHLTIIAQILKDRFPNIRIAYLSSRIYAGYATTTLNPEPHAYESGFSVKWMIENQINGSPDLNYDPARGPVEAPWLAWGPYMWADGLTPRSDGLTWLCSDFNADGTHPSLNGARPKVAGMLLNFFKSDTTARLWFLNSHLRIADFDGDGKDDISVWRPSDGNWHLSQSTDGYAAYTWGASGDQIVPGDFDGDGKADVAVWRPATGMWAILNSDGGTFSTYTWGASGDVPVVGDYDDDGRADVAVYRPEDGNWHVLRSSDGGYTNVIWGVSGDVPVTGDFDGDGQTDIAVRRPSTGEWFINRSTAGFIAVTWGVSTDRVVNADYDGDGKDDVAIWRPSTGEWIILRSSDGGYTTATWGASGDVPVPGDYDGDGRADISVFRNGTWHINQSTSGYRTATWGIGTDIAIPGKY